MHAQAVRRPGAARHDEPRPHCAVELFDAGVDVGATSRAHLAANVAAGALKLTDADRAEIEAVAAERRGPQGEVHELERDRGGRHGSIMKYNLSAEPA